MEFEIDVSGSDLLEKDYTIVIADKNNIIKGYKFDEKTIKIIKSRYGEGKYHYKISSQGRALLKIRIYSVIIYYLFKDILDKIEGKKLTLNICRDFQGHEKDIKSNLISLLRDKLKLTFEMRHIRLQKGSNADKYAHLMRKDKKNLIKGYVKIPYNDIEKFLKQKCARGP